MKQKFFVRKLFLFFFILHCPLFILPSVRADAGNDLSDPMFLEKMGDFGSKTSLDFGKYIQVREIAEFGFSNRFAMAADIRWRGPGGGRDSKFSNIGILATYRAGQGDTGATDILFGFGFGGRGVVPNYSDGVYSVGLRTGKQWTGATLALTVMTNWIFDDWNTDLTNIVGGMAYIDLTPEAYVRLSGGWAIGLGATLRKSTTSAFDQEWVNGKIGTTIGYTGYFANVGYEVESNDLRMGASLNMLF